MELSEIKRNIDNYKEKLEQLRGSLWLRRKRDKYSRIWRKDDWPYFLGWPKWGPSSHW